MPTSGKVETGVRQNFQVEKQSRYPTLDKIVNRLDNQIDRDLTRTKATTFNPYDLWDLTAANPIVDKTSKYSYVSMGSKNGTRVVGHAKNMHTGKLDKTQPSWIKSADPGEIKSNARQPKDPDKGTFILSVIENFTKDMTSPGPWDNEQRDISFLGEKSTEDTSSTASSTETSFLFENSPFNKSDEQKKEKKAEGKLSVWSLGKLVPRFPESDDKKKKTTPMPYVAAHEHYEQVLRNADCHVPKEKVIKVHEVHPDPSKSYSPSCTILHQCSDDTGCCRDLMQVCKPKNTTKVELYFFTTTLGKPQTVEKLYFINHTECECQKRMDESMPRDSEFRRAHVKKFLGVKALGEKRKRNGCTCPHRYSQRYFHNDTCLCDCFDKEDDCLLLKRGRIHFPHPDKVCIQRGTCGTPTCEFGTYLRELGRCPSKRQQQHHHHQHHHHHHNWSRVLTVT
ncbi:hypothetical protein RUM43_009622 [Polyplax serrata]|uniref:Platelet-derived growth factor (PDGF) family profile domain-containing protein n=1 Tax=Polyplax serrata TaxID=468196 RepID=A0AAN8PK91_POLSC